MCVYIYNTYLYTHTYHSNHKGNIDFISFLMGIAWDRIDEHSCIYRALQSSGVPVWAVTGSICSNLPNYVLVYLMHLSCENWQCQTK